METIDEIKREYNIVYSELMSNRFLIFTLMIGMVTYSIFKFSLHWCLLLSGTLWAIGDIAIHSHDKLMSIIKGLRS